MANANKDDQIKCLVINNLSEIDITLYIYVGWAPLCKFSTTSKIINPNQRYVYYEETLFRFEIFAKSLDDKTAKCLLPPEEWKKDKVVTITESLKCKKENLTEFEHGREICLRKVHREEELVHGDLYDILGLNMKEERKKNNEDLKKAIKKAWKKQVLIWHPDKNFGDSEAVIHITLAKDILMDDGRRARYHNQVDYDKGWFSKERWKAVLWPERCTEEQKKAYRRRIRMVLTSLALAVGGIALSLGTAGAAAPVVVILGAIFGGGLTGAGFQSLGHTMSKKSVVDGCEWKSWCYKAGIGFVGGAITGGAGVGITQGIVGIGSAAMQSGAVTAGQYVGMGSATGAVGGTVSSLCSNFGKKYVDKEKVTWKQVAIGAACGGVVGGIAGAVGGLVTKGIVDSRASAATSTLEGDAVEQISALTGGKRIGHAVGHAISKQVTIAGTKSALGIATKVVDERLDDSKENQTLSKHAAEALTDMPVNVLQTAALHTVGGFIGHACEEATLDKQSSSRDAEPSEEEKAENFLKIIEAFGNIQVPENETGNSEGTGEENNEQSNRENEEQNNDDGDSDDDGYDGDYDGDDNGYDGDGDDDDDDEPDEKMGLNPSSSGQKIRMFMINKTDTSGNQSNNADMNKFKSERSHTTSEREAPEPEDQSYEEHCGSTQQNPHAASEESRANQSSNSNSCKENREPSDEVNNEQADDGPPTVTIKYISKGAWVSKMIVTYHLNGEVKKEEVSGDRTRVHISADATNIKVRFQVKRPIWGDIMKYDRFEMAWCKPYVPHIFRYETAVDRTFTLSGPLRWEAVMKVSDEHHEETMEMS